MNQNSLIEIGSKGDVILKFNTDVCVNGRTYKKGEPYLFLRDVSVLIDYGQTEKEATKQQALAAHNNIYPEAVHISGVPFSRRIAALLATFTEEKETYYKNEMKILNIEEDDVEGNYFILENVDLDQPVYLYDENMSLIERNLYEIEYYDTDMNSYIGAGKEGYKLSTNGQYTIFFSSAVEGAKFELKKPHIPYMTMEIQGIGNINKKNAEVFMRFEKVSLTSVLNFNFLEEGTINAPLRFTVLKGESEIWFEDDE